MQTTNVIAIIYESFFKQTTHSSLLTGGNSQGEALQQWNEILLAVILQWFELIEQKGRLPVENGQEAE